MIRGNFFLCVSAVLVQIVLDVPDPETSGEASSLELSVTCFVNSEACFTRAVLFFLN